MKVWLLRIVLFLVGFLTGHAVVFVVRFLEDIVPHGGVF